ncbi:pseudouridine synthase [Russula compacta]|nr:pseudouridine synthase [Russula compacta]
MSYRPSPPNLTSDPPNYETWTREDLIARLKELTGPSSSSITTSSTSNPLGSVSSPPPSPSSPPPPPPPSSSSKPEPKLEPKSQSSPKSSDDNKKPKRAPRREFNFSAYPTRKIALKFSYAGVGYGGLTWQVGETPLPTVEGVLFAALAKARLVDPEGGLDGCGWERCGRTDRGVSAAGQVVSLYVRSSNRPSSTPSSRAHEGGEQDPPGLTAEEHGGAASGSGSGSGSGGPPPALDLDVSSSSQSQSQSSTATTKTGTGVGVVVEEQEGEEQAVGLSRPATTTERDLRYLHTLNAILPPTIRVYAWAPVAPAFSARFSCHARHYKYFFSARNLDVDMMRAAAARLVGEHDFRNLCKLDPAKQLTSFRRRILRADISPLDNDDDGGRSLSSTSRSMHVLDLVGTAFLYNQVRHIMAVLLLIGARLESPSLISALLNAGPDEDSINDSGGCTTAAPAVAEGEVAPPPRVTCKPEYQMADALPLVLWDCVYAVEDASWRTDDAGSEGGSVGLHTQLTGLAERAQVEATLAEHFLAAASEFHRPATARPLGAPGKQGARGPWDVPLGGGRVRREGTYVPVLTRKRLESVETVNARWLARRRRKGK